MTANRPKMPRPDSLSATTTAAAWLAAGVAIGLVQLDSAENTDDDGSGLAEAVVTGRVAAGTAATIPLFAAGTTAGAAAGMTGAGAMRVSGATGRTGAAGAAGATGRTGCAGAGAGEGAGAFWAGGGAGAEAVGVVGGAGEPDDGGATGVGDSEHGPSGRQAACAAPAAPVTTVKASMAAAVPGTSAPRRRGRRIMEYLCSRAGPSRAESCPGYLPTVPPGAPN
ncbi:hypothetical protein QFZ33_001690 [Arthrobacter globiformis]|nr:hypothetical protein [Arthrobacter globiformis]